MGYSSPIAYLPAIALSGGKTEGDASEAFESVAHAHIGRVMVWDLFV